MPMSRVRLILLLVVSLTLCRGAAEAQERVCDSSFEDCRAPLIQLIRDEQVGIDVAFWFMSDSRYAVELIRRWDAGVPVRVLMDTRANPHYPGNAEILAMLRSAGIPMRRKTSGGILHWKMMLFAGQQMVQFSGANYSSQAFVPIEPYVNYVDEVIYFTDDPAVVNSFMTKYDDVWTTTSGYATDANITGLLTRRYPAFAIDPELNFPPGGSSQDFALRSVRGYNAETVGIDSIIYRITDRRHTDALIAARARGIPIRLIVEPQQYRDPTRLWHSWNVDRLYMAGVQIRQRRHLGLVHQKLTVLHGQGTTILGSSNWTSPSANSQLEHNYFTRKSWIYDWSVTHFDRKWHNRLGYAETEPFVPLSPDVPVLRSPANAAQNQPRSVTLRWYAGPWAHRYDVYLGTHPSSLTKVVSDVDLGPSVTTADNVSWHVSGLTEGTTYYWQVVSRTMANVERASGIWSFRTQGSPPITGADDVVLWAFRATRRAGWSPVGDATAAGGFRLENPAAGAPRVTTPLASPSLYFDMSFVAEAGVPYRLWIRGKAARNSWQHDSVHVQFSNSVTAAGAPQWRIGTTSATWVSIEPCNNCGLSGWGWQDNGYGLDVFGPLVYFDRSGEQTIRIQVREDGLSIDQIMLSRSTFLWSSPGANRDDGMIYPERGGRVGDSPIEAPRCDPLPERWNHTGIGRAAPAGTTCFAESTGTFTISGAGDDIWGTSDAFHFVHRTLTGDGSITARVAALQNIHHWAKAGVMMRETLAADARHAMMIVSPERGLAFQRRVNTGGESAHTPGPAGAAPYWVRLVRAGHTFSAYTSVNGVSWTLVGSDTIVMAPTIHVGLPITSHRNGTPATATIDSVDVTP
jgi:hypothetical protein